MPPVPRVSPETTASAPSSLKKAFEAIARVAHAQSQIGDDLERRSV